MLDQTLSPTFFNHDASHKANQQKLLHDAHGSSCPSLHVDPPLAHWTPCAGTVPVAIGAGLPSTHRPGDGNHRIGIFGKIRYSSRIYITFSVAKLERRKDLVVVLPRHRCGHPAWEPSSDSWLRVLGRKHHRQYLPNAAGWSRKKHPWYDRTPATSPHIAPHRPRRSLFWPRVLQNHRHQRRKLLLGLCLLCVNLAKGKGVYFHKSFCGGLALLAPSSHLADADPERILLEDRTPCMTLNSGWKKRLSANIVCLYLFHFVSASKCLIHWWVWRYALFRFCYCALSWLEKQTVNTNSHMRVDTPADLPGSFKIKMRTGLKIPVVRAKWLLGTLPHLDNRNIPGPTIPAIHPATATPAKNASGWWLPMKVNFDHPDLLLENHATPNKHIQR